MRRMLVTVRWPGVRMAPISSISAWRQLRWKNSGAKQRITPAKRAGSRSMAAVLWRETPSPTAHPPLCLRPGNGQTQAKGLRHGFGVQAVSRGIALNMVQKWLGHAQLTTTAIYANAV